MLRTRADVGIRRWALRAFNRAYRNTRFVRGVEIDGDSTRVETEALSWKMHAGARRANPRRYTVLDGMGGTDVFIAHDGGWENTLRGLVERVFCVAGQGGLTRPPLPSPGAYRRMCHMNGSLAKWAHTCVKMSVERFIETCPLPKRRVYIKAAEDLWRFGLQPRDWTLSSFVKYEKICCSKKVDSCPRIIQPRGPKYNLEIGMWMRPLEHEVYVCLDALWGRKTVMKGLNASGVGQALWDAWSAVDDPVAIPLDNSRHDQHVSRDALDFEHDFYKRVVTDKKFAWLLSRQVVNVGKCRTDSHSISYLVEGIRASGDMNTGVGNCLLLCTLVYRFCIETGMGVPGSSAEPGRHGLARVCATLVNNGDDCTLIVPRRFVGIIKRTIQPWFLDFGFELDVGEPVSHIEGIEFCQAHPVKCVDGWRMVRNLDALSKDCLCLRMGHEVLMWAKAVGEGGMALAGCVPVYREFYRKLEALDARPLKGFRALEDSGFMRMAAGMDRREEITDECRASFYMAFGISPDEQIAMEDQYRNTDFRPVVEGRYTPILHRPRVLSSRMTKHPLPHA